MLTSCVTTPIRPMDINEAIAQVEHDLANTMQELATYRELIGVLEADRKKLEVELHGMRSFAQRAAGDDAATAGSSVRSVNPLASPGNHADVVPISGAVSPLQLAVANHSGLASPSLQTLSRTDAVLAVMRASTAPLDRAAIHEQLFHGGREDDTVDDVSLTLSGLKRSKRVERLGKGLWQLVATPAPRSTSEPDRLHSIEN